MIDLIIDFDKDAEKSRLYGVLKGLKGKNVIQIKKWRKQRSHNQNRYLHGVVYRYVGQEIGLTAEEAHQTMKQHFLSYEKQMPNGEVLRFVRSTSDLDTLEMEAYITQIRDFMLEQFSCIIPLPNEAIF